MWKQDGHLARTAWQGMTMLAFNDGRWAVYTHGKCSMPDEQTTLTVATDALQVRGRDLAEAKRRAQCSAMNNVRR